MRASFWTQPAATPGMKQRPERTLHQVRSSGYSNGAQWACSNAAALAKLLASTAMVAASGSDVTLNGPGGRYNAFVAGPSDGSLVLLLHGFPQTRHTWRHQVPALGAAGYRAVAIDQRGYSAGARPSTDELANYEIDRLVADALALAESSADGSKFHLVGHDWGGAVAWMTAAQHPNRLASLTVLSRPHPSAFRQAMAADADGQRTRSRHHKAFLEAETGPLLLAEGARRLRGMLRNQGVPEPHVQEYLSVLGNAEAIEAALAWYRAADLSGMMAGVITVPTLYLWGDKDPSVGAAAATGTREFVAAPYRFEMLPGLGHFLTDEDPIAVTGLLLDHLDNVRDE